MSGESTPGLRTDARPFRGNDSSPKASGGERGRSLGHMGDFISFLANDVFPVEEKWLSCISECSILVEASRQATSVRTSVITLLVVNCYYRLLSCYLLVMHATFMVFRLQEQVAFYKERELLLSSIP